MDISGWPALVFVIIVIILMIASIIRFYEGKANKK
jgi:hypothetical protein